MIIISHVNKFLAWIDALNCNGCVWDVECRLLFWWGSTPTLRV